jgi:hypothetical protein
MELINFCNNKQLLNCYLFNWLLPRRYQALPPQHNPQGPAPPSHVMVIDRCHRY